MNRNLKMRVFAFCCASSLMFALPISAYAMASGSEVFDPSNWIENVLSYIEQGSQYVQQAESKIFQFQMLENQIKSLKGLPDEFKGSYSSLGDIQMHLANWEVYNDNLKNSIGSSRAVASMIKNYARFASAKGVSFNQEAAHLMSVAKSGNKQAQATLRSDAAILQHSNQDLEKVKLSAEKLMNGNPGSKASLQAIALQSNHLVALQTKIYYGTIVKNANEAQKKLLKTAKKQQAVAMETAYSAAQASVNAADEAQLKALQKKYPPLPATGGGEY